MFISLVLTPRFVIPHYVLHLQEQVRNEYFEKSQTLKAPPYFVLKGPTENLTIGLTDPASMVEVEKNRFIVVLTDPINW
ncbi:MAG: hypothetical protein K6E94_00985 [Elusimicrobiaceae bacterium]|nr:hypothetical protein [Elusimicrobiaceae bacterium]